MLRHPSLIFVYPTIISILAPSTAIAAKNTDVTTAASLGTRPSSSPIEEVKMKQTMKPIEEQELSAAPTEEVRIRPTAKPNSHQSVMPNPQSRGRPTVTPVSSKPVEEVV